MKLQIKTLTRKCLVVDIEDTKTVYDLKKELSLYPDVGVEPELQKLIYTGQILANDELLSSYKIDESKFLVIMMLKYPEIVENQATTSEKKTTEDGKNVSDDKKTEEKKDMKAKDEFKIPSTPTTTPTSETSPNILGSSSTVAAAAAGSANVQDSAPKPKTKNDELVEQIVSMGYPESEVRRALEASYFNPERAIEYLIEGIPEAAPDLVRNNSSFANSNIDDSTSAFEHFRQDPTFQDLRSAIQQHPELIESVIQNIGEAHPSVLQLINENQEEFLNMLMEPSDDDDDDFGTGQGD